MNFILDTNVISELVAPDPSTHVLNWIDSLDPASVFLSVITIGEIQKGIARLPDSKRKALLISWLEQDLLTRFRNHILNIDTDVMLVWGQLLADLEKQGQPIPAIDSLVAATTARYGYTLATRNTADFAATGIQLINPWVST
jgi:toxin FitB